MSNLRCIGELQTTNRIGADELSVEWRIRDFLSLPGENPLFAPFESPHFRFDDQHFLLALWPDWTDETRRPASGWVRLGLRRWDGGPPKTSHFSVGIRGSTGVEKRREGEKEFIGVGIFNWNDFCSRSELVEHGARLMPNGVLNITCVLDRLGSARGVESYHKRRPLCTSAPPVRLQKNHLHECGDDGESSRKRKFLESEVNDFSRKTRAAIQRAMEDFGKMLTSGEDSDVTVLVKESQFKVHRNILSARSPVLSAMFRHETAERASNKIVIEDCEPEVFKEYLHFLYTGSVQSLAEQTVFALYRVGDKYLADDLKQLCVDLIRNALCDQTFCDTVKFALSNGESCLLAQAVSFGARNIRSIICTSEWKNFLREYPTEANYVLMRTLGPQCECQKFKCRRT